MHKCKNETEVYSRVTGYHRQIKNWNVGKREEFTDRKFFKLPVADLKLYQVSIVNGKAIVKEKE